MVRFLLARPVAYTVALASAAAGGNMDIAKWHDNVVSIIHDVTDSLWRRHVVKMFDELAIFCEMLS